MINEINSNNSSSSYKCDSSFANQVRQQLDLKNFREDPEVKERLDLNTKGETETEAREENIIINIERNWLTWLETLGESVEEWINRLTQSDITR